LINPAESEIQRFFLADIVNQTAVVLSKPNHRDKITTFFSFETKVVCIGR